jgi:hypothetical protein
MVLCCKAVYRSVPNFIGGEISRIGILRRQNLVDDTTRRGGCGSGYGPVADSCAHGNELRVP